MRIKITEDFDRKFFKQLNYIYDDKPRAALKFRVDVFKKIKGIPIMPYKHRQSIYYTDTNIRDLVFKGYVITYRVRLELNQIEVFGFTKYTERL